MNDYEILKGKSRRLDRAIEIAERHGQNEILVILTGIRDGSLMGRTDRGSNVARLYDRERKMKGW